MTWTALPRWLLAAGMVLAGVMHFVRADRYESIVPPYLPWPAALVAVSGVCEVALGVLLVVPRTRRFAAWGLVALLVAVFPANVYLYQHQELLPAPPLLHLLRLPLQAVLIWWAHRYTRPDPPTV
ncbi:DoxX family protein [Gemmata sp.]|uniref:DoxX family protein n=1 Tax=Gemmata sp. TaxID=1914242 RepID=UPI003F712083